jgi:hypothetical protein
MKQRISIEIISFLLILLFGYAAVSKLLEYETFKVQLSNSPFISQFAGILAWALPIAEIFLVLTLVFTRMRLLGMYISLFLMTMFTAYIYAMLKYSYYIPCSCGGVLSKMSWSTHLLFNILFVALSVAGIFLQTRMGLLKQAGKSAAPESKLSSSTYTSAFYNNPIKSV